MIGTLCRVQTKAVFQSRDSSPKLKLRRSSVKSRVVRFRDRGFRAVAGEHAWTGYILCPVRYAAGSVGHVRGGIRTSPLLTQNRSARQPACHDASASRRNRDRSSLISDSGTSFTLDFRTVRAMTRPPIWLRSPKSQRYGTKLKTISATAKTMLIQKDNFIIFCFRIRNS